MRTFFNTAALTGCALSFSIAGFAQSCEQLLAQPIRIPADTTQAEIAAAEQDLRLFYQCSGLDSLDFRMMIRGPVLTTTLAGAAMTDRQLTYGDWLQAMREYQKTEQYAKTRRIMELTATLPYKKVNPHEWPQDSILFTEIGLPASIIDKIRQHILNNATEGLSYLDVFKSVDTGESTVEDEELTSEMQIPFWENDTLDYREALALSRQLERPVLIYFNGHGAVNARKMEKTVLVDPAVSRYIRQKCVALNLYVDDRTPLPEAEQFTSASGFRVRTVGQRNSNLQMEKYQVSSSPFFCLIDAHEQVLAQSGYTPDAAAFLQFLKAGVDAFGK